MAALQQAVRALRPVLTLAFKDDEDRLLSELAKAVTKAASFTALQLIQKLISEGLLPKGKAGLAMLVMQRMARPTPAPAAALTTGGSFATLSTSQQRIVQDAMAQVLGPGVSLESLAPPAPAPVPAPAPEPVLVRAPAPASTPRARTGAVNAASSVNDASSGSRTLLRAAYKRPCEPSPTARKQKRCGACANCLGMVKFGGPGKKRCGACANCLASPQKGCSQRLCLAPTPTQQTQRAGQTAAKAPEFPLVRLSLMASGCGGGSVMAKVEPQPQPRGADAHQLQGTPTGFITFGPGGEIGDGTQARPSFSVHVPELIEETDNDPFEQTWSQGENRGLEWASLPQQHLRQQQTGHSTAPQIGAPALGLAPSSDRARHSNFALQRVEQQLQVMRQQHKALPEAPTVPPGARGTSESPRRTSPRRWTNLGLLEQTRALAEQLALSSLLSDVCAITATKTDGEERDEVAAILLGLNAGDVPGDDGAVAVRGAMSQQQRPERMHSQGHKEKKKVQPTAKPRRQPQASVSAIRPVRLSLTASSCEGGRVSATLQLFRLREPDSSATLWLPGTVKTGADSTSQWEVEQTSSGGYTSSAWQLIGDSEVRLVPNGARGHRRGAPRSDPGKRPLDEMAAGVEIQSQPKRAKPDMLKAALMVGGDGTVALQLSCTGASDPPMLPVQEAAEGLKLHLSSQSATGYKGIYVVTGRQKPFVAGRWRSANQTRTWTVIGRFDTAVEAAVAYARHWLPKYVTLALQPTADGGVAVSLAHAAQGSGLKRKQVLTAAAEATECHTECAAESSLVDGGARKRTRFGGMSSLEWVQCEECQKWRELSQAEDAKLAKGDSWTCALNSDPRYNRCEVPEDPRAWESY